MPDNLALSSEPVDRSDSSVRALQDGWDLLIQQAKMISLLPLEEWLAQFDRAEALAPLLDPTSYREYIFDPEQKGQRIQNLIRLAIPLKQEILKLQALYGPKTPDRHEAENVQVNP
jgi:hypothetical protein